MLQYTKIYIEHHQQHLYTSFIHYKMLRYPAPVQELLCRLFGCVCCCVVYDVYTAGEMEARLKFVD
jgi:hypothetical protein